MDKIHPGAAPVVRQRSGASMVPHFTALSTDGCPLWPSGGGACKVIAPVTHEPREVTSDATRSVSGGTRSRRADRLCVRCRMPSTEPPEAASSQARPVRSAVRVGAGRAADRCPSKAHDDRAPVRSGLAAARVSSTAPGGFAELVRVMELLATRWTARRLDLLVPPENPALAP